MSTRNPRHGAPASWKPPGHRREVIVAVATGLSVVLGTAGIIWGMHALWDDSGGTVTPPIQLPTSLPDLTGTTAGAPPTTGPPAGEPAPGSPPPAPEAPTGTSTPPASGP